MHETKAVDREDLDELWEPETAPLHERALWRSTVREVQRAGSFTSTYSASSRSHLQNEETAAQFAFHVAGLRSCHSPLRARK